MADPSPSSPEKIFRNRPASIDFLLVGSSILLQLLLALFLGHAYDMRIFMATGYLAGTGQNPYLAQDLSAVFHNPTFGGITSFGYPPPWALISGFLYLCSYKLVPDFLLYNLALKLPIIAANIALAYLAAHVLRDLGAPEKATRRAWIFLLFNPFLLLTSAAWGQFDPLVALLALLSIYWMYKGKLAGPAILLALAVSLKPTALPLILVALIFLAGSSFLRTLKYFAVFAAGMVLFCVVPFLIFGWDPSPIFQHWNAHFTVGGGLSFMTFQEYVTWSYQLAGLWWIAGWVWVPALGFAALALRRGIHGLPDLLKKSAALILVFFLSRAWLSETNLNLVLPFVLILVSIKELDRLSLAALWVLPLLFSFVNTSLAQLLFPSLPGLMDSLLRLAVDQYILRYAVRTILVILWLFFGWRIVLRCFRGSPAAPGEEKISPQSAAKERKAFTKIILCALCDFAVKRFFYPKIISRNSL